MYMGPFGAQAATISLAVTATASTSVTLPGVGSVIRIVNAGPNTAFIAIGATTQTATVPTTTAAGTATPVIVGDTTFTIPNGLTALQISAICAAAGTATLYLQIGEGL